jgi:hypothetical protein
LDYRCVTWTNGLIINGYIDIVQNNPTFSRPRANCLADGSAEIPFSSFKK